MSIRVISYPTIIRGIRILPDDHFACNTFQIHFLPSIRLHVIVVQKQIATKSNQSELGKFIKRRIRNQAPDKLVDLLSRYRGMKVKTAMYPKSQHMQEQ